MNDAFDITGDSLASGFFCEFREGAGLRHEYIDQFAPHRSHNAPQGTERDAGFGFGLFKLLDGLSGCPHFLADLALAKAQRLAHGGDPPSGRTRREATPEIMASVPLRES